MFRLPRAPSLALTAALTMSLMLAGVPMGTAADEDDGDRLQLANSEGTAALNYIPLSFRGSADANFIIKLADDPVAIRQSKAGRRFSAAEKAAIKSDLAGKQNALRRGIEQRGGTMVGQYQSAYNGIRVRIARDAANALRTLPGVIDVQPAAVFEPTNVRSVPFIGTPAVWDGAAGLHGEGVKVGIIDSGIDYTHANFGGPGTVAAFNAARATSTAAPDPTLIGPAAPKVKGGTDLVGDDFNAASADPSKRMPHPDPNPLDCNGHGSHVAGTAAGFGVKADGATYTGAYDASTYATTNFAIGPGVAPKADLYAIRVFGCEGATDVVVDAIDWAVDHDLDVINLSLGASLFGGDTADAEAADNASLAGLVVVASAGNSGAQPYIIGSPSTATRAISVAATDSTATFPGLHLALDGGAAVDALSANGISVTGTPAWDIVVLRDASQPGGVSLGCNPDEYTAAGVAGKLVVVQRGTCARVARAIYGQKAGAAAVAMINNVSGYPPFEGQITSNPDTGEAFTVTIPFLGIRNTATGADATALIASAGATASNTTVANPTFKQVASFSSRGPALKTSALKPDVAAPGVSIFSTASGTGNQGTVLSGTSMAAPHVSGVAALTLQAHPGWASEDLKAAIVNTASAAQVASYRTSLAGSGLVQPARSTKTSTVAVGDAGTASLSFGFTEITTGSYSASRTITLRNHSTSAATFSVSSAANGASRPHTITSAGSVSVPANGTATLSIGLAVNGADVSSASSFREVAGQVVLTPTAGSNNGVALAVPYYLVPRARANVATALDGKLNPGVVSTTATVTNVSGARAGNADVYAWGLSSPNNGLGSSDLRAVGVQSFNFGGAIGQVVVFAVSTWTRANTQTENEYDIWVDRGGDGRTEFAVVGVDQGLATPGGSRNGVMGTFVFNTSTGKLVQSPFLATAPTDGSIVELPVPASMLGLTPNAGTFHYTAASFGFRGGGKDRFNGKAHYDAFNSSVTQGQFFPVAPDATTSTTFAMDATQWGITPVRGLMVVTTDNRAGAAEAQLIDLPAN